MFFTPEIGEKTAFRVLFYKKNKIQKAFVKKL